MRYACLLAVLAAVAVALVPQATARQQGATARERLAMQAFEIGQAAQHGEAATLHLGGQLVLARELQGRRLELLAPVAVNAESLGGARRT